MRQSGLYKITYTIDCPKTIVWSTIGDHGWIGCFKQRNRDHIEGKVEKTQWTIMILVLNLGIHFI